MRRLINSGPCEPGLTHSGAARRSGRIRAPPARRRRGTGLRERRVRQLIGACLAGTGTAVRRRRRFLRTKPVPAKRAVARIGAGNGFSKGHELVAWLGLWRRRILDRRPYHPRQDIDARQSPPARAVRAGGPDGGNPASYQSWARYGLTPSSEAARKRRHHNLFAIALANQLAGIAGRFSTRSATSAPQPAWHRARDRRGLQTAGGGTKATVPVSLDGPCAQCPHNVPAEERPHGTNKPIRREPVRCRFPAEVCERMKWRVLPVPSALRRSVR
jgi:hypothetical protein